MAIGSIFNFSVSGPGKQFNVSNLYKNFGTNMGNSWRMSPDSDGNYTLTGTLIQTFTTSGTYTPSSGISLIDVVVIGGGGSSSYDQGAGSGGEVVVYRSVPVTPGSGVPVTIGGSNTESSFGTLIARAGRRPGQPGTTGPFSGGKGWGLGGLGTGGTSGNGANGWRYAGPSSGPKINGVAYAGGGASYDGNSWTSRGDGGGGIGPSPANGVNGFGGGAASGSAVVNNPIGGSGRVIIYGAM